MVDNARRASIAPIAGLPRLQEPGPVTRAIEDWRLPAEIAAALRACGVAIEERSCLGDP